MKGQYPDSITKCPIFDEGLAIAVVITSQKETLNTKKYVDRSVMKFL